jgi:hypothetical protein
MLLTITYTRMKNKYETKPFLIKTSRSFISKSVLYDDGFDEFGFEFDPSHFDEIEEPPPVHILYPRPSYNKACSKLSRNYNQVINSSLIASILFLYFSINQLFL